MEAIAKCASELKRTPTKKEFRALTGISEKAVCTRFGSFGSAVRAAGVVTVGPGYQTSDEDQGKEIARIAQNCQTLKIETPCRGLTRIHGGPGQVDAEEEQRCRGEERVSGRIAESAESVIG